MESINNNETSVVYIDVDGKFLVNGTENDPVDMFPSVAFQKYAVEINGRVEANNAGRPLSSTIVSDSLSYVNIINPKVNDVTFKIKLNKNDCLIFFK